MVTDASLVLAHTEDDLYHLELNRPSKRNAIDEAMVAAMHTALDARPVEPHCLLISSGVAKVFAAGADLRELRKRDAQAALRRINVELFERIAAYRWPTFAAVDGHAIGGGCELALACDFRVASESATFSFPETSLGVIPGAGGVWRLLEYVNRSTASMMILTGRRLRGTEALSAGLVDEVDPDPVAAAKKLIADVAKRSWTASELVKLSIRDRESPSTALDVVSQALLFDTDDKRSRIDDVLAAVPIRQARNARTP